MQKKIKFDAGSDLNFRYTDDITRTHFIEELYPISNLLIKSISKIPWKKYKFIGETECSIMNEDESIEIFDVDIISCLSKYPYYIFGGSACELYGKEYKDVVNIHDIVDPSADIDIRIQFPQIFKEDNPDFIYKNEEYNILITYENKVSKLTEHYTLWLFNEVVKMIQKNVLYFNNTVCSLPNLEDDHETEHANLSKAVGPILITRSYLFKDNAIKIQVSTKIDNESQHFIEFILIIDDGSINQVIKKEDDIKQNENKYKKIDDVYVQNLDSLIDNQYEAFINRFGMRSKTFLYKVYNHCTRILFLLRIYKYLKISDELSEHQKIYTVSSQLNKRLYDFYKLIETKDVRKSYCSKFTKEIKEILEFLFPNSIKTLKNKLITESRKQHVSRSASIFETIRSRKKSSSSKKKTKSSSSKKKTKS